MFRPVCVCSAGRFQRFRSLCDDSEVPLASDSVSLPACTPYGTQHDPLGKNDVQRSLLQSFVDTARLGRKASVLTLLVHGEWGKFRHWPKY